MSACSRPLVVLGVGVMALLAAVTAAARVAEDGGSATYTGDGPTYLFDVTNSGSTTWKYFYFVGPPGSGFTGGQLTGGATGPCVPGQPDGTPNEIECGPLSSGGGPGTLVLFTGTTSAPVACASAFQLFVNSTGTPPYTRVGDAVFGGSCSTPPPPPPDCDAERAALAAARGRLEALQLEKAALAKDWQRARAGAEQADAELTNMKIGAVLSAGLVELFGAVEEAESAVTDAGRRIANMHSRSTYLATRLAQAIKDVAAAEAALAACQGSDGPSFRWSIVGHLGVAKICGDEQVAVAYAKARQVTLSGDAKRLPAASLARSERRLRAASARLSKALPRAPGAAKPHGRKALALMGNVDKTMRRGVKGIARVTGAAKAAAAQAASAQEALAACQS